MNNYFISPVNPVKKDDELYQIYIQNSNTINIIWKIIENGCSVEDGNGNVYDNIIKNIKNERLDNEYIYCIIEKLNRLNFIKLDGTKDKLDITKMELVVDDLKSLGYHINIFFVHFNFYEKFVNDNIKNLYFESNKNLSREKLLNIFLNYFCVYCKTIYN